MGGKLFKTERLTKQKYSKVLNEFLEVLNGLNISAQEVPTYRNKESFGDIDVLTVSEDLPNTYNELILNELRLLYKNTEYSSNGNIKSFLFREAQIDLITIPKKQYNLTLDMLSWNGLGGFIGQMLSTYGIKLSNKDGIGTNVNALTNSDLQNKPRIFYSIDNIDLALDLANLNKERFREGFDTKEDIFEYVCSSDLYFDGMFTLENDNNPRQIHLDLIEYTQKRQAYTKKYLTEIDVANRLSNLLGTDVIKDANRLVIESKLNEIIQKTSREYRQKALNETLTILYDENANVSDFFKNKIINSKMSTEEMCKAILRDYINNF